MLFHMMDYYFHNNTITKNNIRYKLENIVILKYHDTSHGVDNHMITDCLIDLKAFNFYNVNKQRLWYNASSVKSCSVS